MSGGVYAVVIDGVGAWYSHAPDMVSAYAADMNRLAGSAHPCDRLQDFYRCVDQASVRLRILSFGHSDGAADEVVAELVDLDETSFNRPMAQYVEDNVLRECRCREVEVERVYRGVHMVFLDGEPFTMIDAARPLRPGRYRYTVDWEGRLLS